MSIAVNTEPLPKIERKKFDLYSYEFKVEPKPKPLEKLKLKKEFTIIAIEDIKLKI